ncbi:hypothetical protein KIH74_32430 [Kineosporia sp. J2-2]|uniref:Uncharacterized protein n=1 Tax=Kineosporia corallincola TaxID=2835133 RepID=A0ABS5TSA9_9ACTN|nr:hypothetical protein [Kineosporia corallincola]MBT0773697.1 hypothetical protein [Kineosporia corallincola]
MDIALIVLILGTAGYAGIMALLLALRRGTARPVLIGAASFVGVAAGFFAAVGLARLAHWGVLGLVAALVGGGTYLALSGDLGGRRAGRAALVASVVVTCAAVFVSYLAPMAYVVTVSTYLLLRLWVRTRPALMIMSTAFCGLLVVALGVFYVGVSRM